jgi:hypothetical protein
MLFKHNLNLAWGNKKSKLSTNFSLFVQKNYPPLIPIEVKLIKMCHKEFLFLTFL